MQQLSHQWFTSSICGVVVWVEKEGRARQYGPLPTGVTPQLSTEEQGMEIEVLRIMRSGERVREGASGCTVDCGRKNGDWRGAEVVHMRDSWRFAGVRSAPFSVV